MSITYISYGVFVDQSSTMPRHSSPGCSASRQAYRGESSGDVASEEDGGDDVSGGTEVKEGNRNDFFDRAAGDAHSATRESRTGPRPEGKNK